MIHMRLEAQKEVTPITPGALAPIKEAMINRAMPNLITRPIPKQQIRNRDFEAGMDAGSGVPLSSPISTQGSCNSRLR